MIRIDITDHWERLRGDLAEVQRYILNFYGADRIGMHAFPDSALYDRAGNFMGLVQTYGYPRVTVEGERVYLELADLVIPFDPADRSDLREKLAALAHEQWSGWMRYMFSKAPVNEDGSWTMPAWAVERWQRQMQTPYSDLSEEEKASDRTEAGRVLALFDEGDERSKS